MARLLALSLSLCLLTLETATAASIRTLLTEASAGGRYVAPDPAELGEAEVLFGQLLQGKRGQPLQQAWARLDFEMQLVREGGAEFIVLREAPDHKMGRGFYVFRLAAQLPVGLQAPHSFQDEGTRTITLRLMAEGAFAAAAWNTVPRSYREGIVRSYADVAHLSQSYFIALTRAFARQYPDGHLVQLHGFAKSKRRTLAAASADIILSSGSKRPSHWLRDMAACLKRSGPDVVRVYPLEVRELGAKTNRVGLALRQMGHAGFVHVELSRQMRRQVRNKAAIRQRLLDCLPEGLL